MTAGNDKFALPVRRADALDAWQMLLGLQQAAQGPQSCDTTLASVPFTLVSGFLGSGKTTLLTHLLEQPSGLRLAVMVNDFGSVGIDSSLIRSRDASTIDLSNGCACCSLSAGLAESLTSLLARPRRPDAIILEASGVANPLGVLHVALANPGVHLNGVITVVDAETLMTHLANPLICPTVVDQTTAADIIVMSKFDLIHPFEAARIREKIRAIAPQARIVEAIHGNVSTEIILGIEPRSQSTESPERSAVRHQNPFSKWTWASDRPLNERLLGSCAGELPPAIVRAKGFVLGAGEPSRPLLLQVVGRRWSLARQSGWDGRRHRTEIVFIALGPFAAAQELENKLQSCEVP